MIKDAGNSIYVCDCCGSAFHLKFEGGSASLGSPVYCPRCGAHRDVNACLCPECLAEFGDRSRGWADKDRGAGTDNPKEQLAPDAHKDFDALVVLIARTLGDEEWQGADDDQIREAFDPWETLRKLKVAKDSN